MIISGIDALIAIMVLGGALGFIVLIVVGAWVVWCFGQGFDDRGPGI